MSEVRIAYVINSVEGGGAQSPVPAIARVFRDYGAKVRVFALTRRDGRGLPAIERAGLDPLVREGGEKDHLAAARWLTTQLRDWGATHLWTSLSRATILGLLVGPKLGLPVISWQHNAFLKPWNRRLMRLLQSRAELWVGDSRSVTNLTAQRLAVEQDRLVTWPIYCADPAMPVAKPWAPGDPLRIGSLGRLHPAKGYDVLIAALARLQANGFAPPAPLEITIAGEGAERGRLEKLARDAGIENIRFPGHTDNPRDFLAGLHLYVQPSRAEGFCIAAHEALTAGLPIVASSVGELLHTVVTCKAGFVVPPEDANALAAALVKALSDPAALARMGTAARADMLQRFSQESFTQIGSAIWQRIRPASNGDLAQDQAKSDRTALHRTA